MGREEEGTKKLSSYAALKVSRDENMIDEPEFDYVVDKSGSRRTIAIIIDPERGVVVKAPARTPPDKVLEFIHKKSNWILKKIGETENMKQEMPSHSFCDGEVLPYLGEKYVLSIRRGIVEDVSIDEKFIVVHVLQTRNADTRVVELLTEWYKVKALEAMKDAANRYIQKLGIDIPLIRVRDQKKRWGSCSSKGVINLNWKLVTAPKHILEYVVAHEICHVKHPHHQRDFWLEMESLLQDYKERRIWLKSNGHKLGL